MTLNRTQIAEVAHMARLRLTENELDKYTDINKILDLAEQINEIDTRNTTPTSHPLNLYQRLREDTVTEPNLRDVLQAIATCVELGLYLVPQVIE
ncbi:MAG: Asp-tRNA(Asn)/Glu-tRNA(Gln) amidotransferase subunit GatC [Gammaproteobacteria bacterium]|jgi:aspartyl-tRNA(Asn)/glutamyl-tRNA(Gln) amidotransferase subunit C